jgi:hypothetical protein
MKLWRSMVLSLSLVVVTGGLAFAQTGGMPGGTGTGTGGTPAAPKSGGPIEKDIDLPLDKPILKQPPKPIDPPPPPPPPPPVEPPPPTIYGKDLKSENGTIIYVLDISGSMGWDMGQYTTPDGKTAMGNKLDRAKAELVKSVMSLPKNFKFNMVAFDCGVFQWQGSMVVADDGNKNTAIGWIMALQPQGATGTGPATTAGLSDKTNKLVVLLTDGAPNCGAGNGWGDSSCIAAHRSMISQNNSSKATINVFGIGATGEFKQFCMNVAGDNGGSYTDVQ